MVILEIIREGMIPHFERLSGPLVRIGRAFDNELIIDDQYLDPHHLELDVSDPENWTARDLNTENGSFLDGKRFGARSIDSGDELYLGKTRVKVFNQYHEVSPAASLRNLEQRLLNLATIPRLVFLFMLAAVLYITAVYISSAGRDIKPDNVLKGIISMLWAPVLLASLWALLSRVLRGQARIVPVLSIAVIALIISFVSEPLINLAYYNFPGAGGAVFLETLFFSITVGVYAYLMLVLTTRMKQKFSLVIAGIAMVGIVGLFLLDEIYDSDDHKYYLRYDGRVGAPVFLFRSGKNMQSYLEALPELFDEAGRLAEEED